MVTTGCHYCSTKVSSDTPVGFRVLLFLIVISSGCNPTEKDESSTKILQFKEYEKWILPSKA